MDVSCQFVVTIQIWMVLVKVAEGQCMSARYCNMVLSCWRSVGYMLRDFGMSINTLSQCEAAYPYQRRLAKLSTVGRRREPSSKPTYDADKSIDYVRTRG